MVSWRCVGVICIGGAAQQYRFGLGTLMCYWFKFVNTRTGVRAALRIAQMPLLLVGDITALASSPAVAANSCVACLPAHC